MPDYFDPQIYTNERPPELIALNTQRLQNLVSLCGLFSITGKRMDRNQLQFYHTIGEVNALCKTGEHYFGMRGAVLDIEPKRSMTNSDLHSMFLKQQAALKWLDRNNPLY